MHTTGRVAQVGGRVICLYRSGRAHAGDNLSALLARCEARRDPPIVMSDALAANQRDDDDTLIRCHCLAHGRRQFTDLEEVFPVESHHVITVLNQVFEHEAVTRARCRRPTGWRTTRPTAARCWRPCTSGWSTSSRTARWNPTAAWARRSPTC